MAVEVLKGVQLKSLSGKRRSWKPKFEALREPGDSFLVGGPDETEEIKCARNASYQYYNSTGIRITVAYGVDGNVYAFRRSPENNPEQEPPLVL